MLGSQSNNKRTKIVATIGPNSWNEDILRQMIRAGMNVARINFSHGNHDQHAKTIALVRQVAESEDCVIAVMCDLQGPKIRIGRVADEPLMLNPGDKITLTLDDVPGEAGLISLPHPEFICDIKKGMSLLLDDGNLELEVTEATDTVLTCKVIVGGPLLSSKGVTARNAHLSLSTITDKDREDVAFALEQKTDYIALSFVRSVDDICELRELVKQLGGDAGLIAKIEKHEALECVEAIIEASDGVMVARGDLGLETPAEEVPFHQKRIIRLCNEASKPVITATQMLNSMVDMPRPTRAEASDVYNAIVDGTDAVMLSNETTVGEYPVEAVKTMANIAAIAEQHIWEDRSQQAHMQKFEASGEGDEAIANAVGEATYHIANALKPRAIVTATMTGYTARRVARERPQTPIVCVTPNPITYRRMALVWGLRPLLVPRFDTVDEMISIVIDRAYESNFVQTGDILVIIAGVPFWVGGKTNLLKVHYVGDRSRTDCK